MSSEHIWKRLRKRRDVHMDSSVDEERVLSVEDLNTADQTEAETTWNMTKYRPRLSHR